jgi:hypothetical protein
MFEREGKMKRLIGIFTVAVVSMFTFANISMAQQPVPDSRVVVERMRVFQGPEGAPPPGADVVFIASESFGGKVVKGAPYSAESITESVQTLSDGNRIVNKITSTVYRDSEGRLRREQTLKGLGVLGASEEPLQMIFINDPVAGVTYSLDSRTRTAHKTGAFSFGFSGKAGAHGVEGQRFEFKVAPGGSAAASTAGSLTMTQPHAGTAVAGTRMPLPEGGVSASTYVFRTKPGPNANEVKEDLGKLIIEGVEAEGTRTTVTIPAGEIGNERSIEIVSERWYSPELQLVVMTRHSDPRSGETTYKLTNINRSEPARSLFEVPSDYTIKTNLHMAPSVAPLPRSTRKPANPE